LKNMSFYFNSDKIIFIFDPYVIWPYSSWVINISFDIQDIAEYLNKDVVIIPEKKVDLVEDQNLLTLPIKEEEKAYEWVDLNNYIIFDEIEYEEAKKLEKGKKYIALTFDDWPNKANTPLLLDILKENNVKATFFVLWKNANYFPDIIKQIDANWHEIWSHSWDHPQLTRLDENEVKTQVQNTDEVIYNTIWKTPRLFRPPYGEHNNDTDEIIDRTILLRSIDSLDWKNKNVEKNIKNVVDSAKEWSIILMHDIHKTTIDSIDQIIKSLKDKWFEFVTTSELLKHYQTEDYSHKSCFSGFNCK
jgi:peptidoglycan/xylan/chitin deacetylase (PgdA/CDA1 family)